MRDAANADLTPVSRARAQVVECVATAPLISFQTLVTDENGDALAVVNGTTGARAAADAELDSNTLFIAVGSYVALSRRIGRRASSRCNVAAVWRRLC